MKDGMKQCLLINIWGERQVSWIPEEFAKQGKVVDLKENGQWSEGWYVDEAYDTVLSYTVVRERSRDYLRTREASDI